jgi:2-keto-4-pentenoate hydratase/2-oxohepta-3-ene-1,7-dioic acid hydratase in catechol pathway
MLDGLAPVTRSAPIALVVNTHGNGDHWFGNAALPNTPIIASATASREMRQVGPAQIRELLSDQGAAGAFAREIFEPFDFVGLELIGADRLDNMAWSFAEMVAYASRGTTVVPGDVLGSGTCGGGCQIPCR